MTDTLAQAVQCFKIPDFPETVRLCRAHLVAAPGDPAARLLLGKALAAAGNAEAAETEFRELIRLQPPLIEAWLQWSGLLQKHGLFQKASDCLRAGLEANPQSAELHNDLAVASLALGDFGMAETHITQAIQIAPEWATGFCNLALLLRKQGKVADAEAAARKAVVLNADFPEAFNLLGEILMETDLESAEASFMKALNLRPSYAEALDNLGIIRFFQDRANDALEMFDRALQVNPAFKRATSHKTSALFVLQRFPEAWKLHRQRFALAGVKHDPHGRFAIPEWQGQDLKGEAVLIWTEFGLGEEILQAGMFNDVVQRARHLTVECSPRLVRLFQRSFPDIVFIPRLNASRASRAPVEANVQIAGGNLGAAVRNKLEDFTPHQGYLRADAINTETIRRRYTNGRAGPIIGVAWASPRSPLATQKSLPLSEFSPILQVPGATFVSLQYEASAEDVKAVGDALGIEILFDPHIDHSGDMDNVAAQVAAMDLVISASNTIVHVAGALNIPVWNIIPSRTSSGMWHWFSRENASPWYPSMRLYRHGGSSTMRDIADDLQTFLRDRAT